MEAKEILKLLLEITHVEGRYTGGGDEPDIIVFTDSEDYVREEFLLEVANKIADHQTTSLREENDRLREALEQIEEYLNGGVDSAVDAAEICREIAEQALKTD